VLHLEIERHRQQVPIISLLPADRRKTFMILVADNLRTLDGNAARGCL